ncbi:MAG: hypothetical protein NT051_03200 [Candidatus Micrarchaeota archaeon]|nr:hypothetical protein [Candidatus Micrarchaeota archaeon]
MNAQVATKTKQKEKVYSFNNSSAMRSAVEVYLNKQPTCNILEKNSTLDTSVKKPVSEVLEDFKTDYFSKNITGQDANKLAQADINFSVSVDVLAKRFAEIKSAINYKKERIHAKYDRKIMEGTFWDKAKAAFPWLGGVAVADLVGKSDIWAALVQYAQQLVPQVKPNMVKEALIVAAGICLAFIASRINKMTSGRINNLEERCTMKISSQDKLEQLAKDFSLDLADLVRSKLVKDCYANDAAKYAEMEVFDGDERTMAGKIVGMAKYRLCYDLRNPFKDISDIHVEPAPLGRWAGFVDGMRKIAAKIRSTVARVLSKKPSAAPIPSDSQQQADACQREAGAASSQ